MYTLRTVGPNLASIGGLQLPDFPAVAVGTLPVWTAVETYGWDMDEVSTHYADGQPVAAVVVSQYGSVVGVILADVDAEQPRPAVRLAPWNPTDPGCTCHIGGMGRRDDCPAHGIPPFVAIRPAR